MTDDVQFCGVVLVKDKSVAVWTPDIHIRNHLAQFLFADASYRIRIHLYIRVCFTRQFRHAEVGVHKTIAETGFIHGIECITLVVNAEFLQVRHPGAQPFHMGLCISLRILAARPLKRTLVTAEQYLPVGRMAFYVVVMGNEINLAYQFTLIIILRFG